MSEGQFDLAVPTPVEWRVKGRMSR